ncbi:MULTISPECIES: phenylacetate--CoA ligase family protein [unclassified Methanosarcina]|uniref:phenylacetate--CoA ligase family protein n=1 Tax=unclassified Methanosarcina TaxID=2644672 RepID=UPI0006157C03|nr:MULTISPECIES: phenylacetate--CoA ligase family protein [unclassified Methanosarcina]AKB17641.1 capsular polysaccharide biosynthesis protein [Methanosarcina sp. WWM596]AKB21012.1 capsular polysaccharide biosynthesis protein [Methanosarcina sp. WH1]
MFQKPLFITAHQLGERGFYPLYKKLVDSQWKSYPEQKKDQEKQLKHVIVFAYKNVPYYHKLFNKLKLEPSDIRKIEDLEKLPILTKDTIKQNFEDFKPVNLSSIKYYLNSTGGSTGNPLQFRLSKYDRFFNGASLYRGWGYAGYELGDKMVFLAGSSLDIGSGSFVVQKAHEIVRNLRKLSSYDMSTEDMQQYAKTINSFKPQFIRGYASSLNFFSEFLSENKIDVITPQAVFTAAEKLIPHMRKNIENAFGCEVFDGYGLNDGGLGAYECKEHNGLHIDTERSILEVVDENGSQLENGTGRIIATSLHNYAMPFIRYETGDMGHIVSDVCGCGRGSRLLKEVLGRQQEILQTPEGKFVYGGFFSRIFWEISGVKEFQIIQKKLNTITIKMVLEENFDENQLDIIRKIIKSKSEQWEIEFIYVDEIERTKAGKYKFILSEL